MSVIRTFTIQLPVNYNFDWKGDISRGAPNTVGCSDIWDVANKFPEKADKGTVVEKLLVAQFGKSYPHKQALSYAMKNAKPHVHPKVLWAIGEHYPTLADEQGEEHMFLHSGRTWTTRGVVYMPYLYCGKDGYRKADVTWAEGIFCEFAWFVFSL